MVQVLVPRCLQLAPAYHNVAANQTDNEQNTLYARGLCFIFSELGESYVTDLLPLGEQELTFVTLLSNCADNSDPDIARRTFEFWYRLRNEVEHCDTSEQQQKKNILGPAYTQVAISSIKHLKCPDDFDDLSEQEELDLRHLRNEVADALGGRPYPSAVAY